MVSNILRTIYPFISLQTLFGHLLSVVTGSTQHPVEVEGTKRFVLTDTYIGRDFLDRWTWETIDDPTHGRVDYVDQKAALELNLTSASDSKFIMRADSKNIVNSYTRGRKSIRIHSNDAYDESISILDLQHMPEGCATWPAFWTLSQKGPWPHGGEVDILEGVNLDQRNVVSLHTTPSCTMPGTHHRRRSMNGNVTSLDCDTRVNFNQGCGVSMSKPASYGTDFNTAGGGYFALVRTKHGDEGPNIRVWFWTRFDPALPPEIKTPPEPDAKTGQRSIYPTRRWGLPEADFPLQRQCDYSRHFDPHMFIFDLTFCGDWAGSVYPGTGCPGTCTDYVDNNPEAFRSAYWEVNSLRVYTPGK